MSKLLYLDCSSGIAGDMLVAALLDAGGDWDNLDRQLKSLALAGAHWTVSTVRKKGFAAQQFQVSFPPQHAHRHLKDIYAILDQANLTERADKLARQLFLVLGQAEADVHGTDLQKVHFHEVGAIDSIVDIVAIAILMDQLDIAAVYCSGICTGFGEIEIAHGKVQVPAPATVRLLQGFQIHAGAEAGEMVTPTGAAFLAAFAETVVGLPEMTLSGSGTGAGTRDLDSRANILRVYLGETELAVTSASQLPFQVETETIWEVACQVDDMTGQQLAALQRRLLALEVRDCFLTNVQMKKGRPGIQLTVHCASDQLAGIQEILLKGSTTLGVRYRQVQRAMLPRQSCEISSPWGPIRGKRVLRPDGQWQATAEFDEVQRLAAENDLTEWEVSQRLADPQP